MTILPFPKKSEGCCCGTKNPVCIVLPLCPKANSRLRRDGDTNLGRAILLEGALTWIQENLQQGAQIETLMLDGPGDPLATPQQTLDMVASIAQKYPDLKKEIATLGLHGWRYADALAEAGISGVTLFVDAVTPETVQKLYAWIRPATKTLPLSEAAEILVQEQELAIRSFLEAGIRVQVRTTVSEGNCEEVEAIAEKMAANGVKHMTLVSYLPTETSGSQGPISEELMTEYQGRAALHIDEVVIATKDISDSAMIAGSLSAVSQAAMLPKPTPERPNVAVASSNGMEIDLHLGQAYQLLIYGPREDGLACLLGTRPVPDPGGGGSRWEELSEALADCFVILAAHAGESPKKILKNNGITVLQNDGEISGTVDALFGGGKKGKCKK